MSLIKIIFDEEKKETHAIFKHIDQVYVYTTFITSDKLTDGLSKVNTLDVTNMYKCAAKDQAGNYITTDKTNIIHRYARVSDSDVYNKYVGAAMVIAEEYAGSKTQLKKDFLAAQAEANFMYPKSQLPDFLNIETWAYEIRMPEIYGNLERFKAYIDKHTVNK